MYSQHYQLHPKRGMSTAAKFAIVVGIIFLILCGGGVACMGLVGSAANEAANQIDSEREAKLAGVKLVKCDTREMGNQIFPHVKVSLEIVNTTKDQQTFFMDLFVNNEDQERVGNTTEMVTDVRPDQTVQHIATVPLTGPLHPDSKLSCSVDKVS